MVSSKPDLRQVVAAALAEVLGERNFDVTTSSIVDVDLMGEAVVIARKPGVVFRVQQMRVLVWPAART